MYEEGHPVGRPRMVMAVMVPFENNQHRISKRYPYIPNHNSKCNCFSDLYQSTLTRQNIPSVQLIISGVVVDWSLSGVIVHILLAISIPYLTKEQLKLGNYICYEILTYKLSKL